MTSRLIAVYGAYGHTGRLVTAELLSRGRELILAGRDAEALRTMAGGLKEPGQVRTFPASVDDPAAMRELTGKAAVVVHCAGPFSVTGAPLATAAAEAGCHYLDHALEPHHVKGVFDTLQETAQHSGSVLIPGLSFYGGLGDLLAGAVAGGLTAVERLVVAYAVSGWRLTTGAKNTAAQLFAETQRITFSDGALRTGYVEPRNAVFAFPPPLGPRTVITPLPSFEPFTVPRHVPARNVDLMLTAATFEEEGTFDSEHLDDAARSRTDFTIAVQAVTEEGGRAGHLRGHDLWRAGALASAEAAVRLADRHGPVRPAVLSPAEAFPAGPFLRTLERLGAFEVHLPGAQEVGQ
ncbi:saccharopine dehydrogenase NADP-binding domain-containing protein [Streptomyces sp. ACA25]|uniref:saccharopine dehydrogenase NADP-binding domain-containing protein n=1 Tax=Streptomyces sp. ACA25 TaxID=3022596 RepID=UPI0023078423|nr:saccharopine dehydrogenase NADP-binding domain-containing protein [Streptomyces sp. ACA25]MDB1089053.1 saccharopine dehydrogenase NADP-binding domain-containing protein [Streptomyces sp. ACA25]